MLTLLSGSATGVYATSAITVDGTSETADLSNFSISNSSHIIQVNRNGQLDATGTNNTNINISGTNEGSTLWTGVKDK